MRVHSTNNSGGKIKDSVKGDETQEEGAKSNMKYRQPTTSTEAKVVKSSCTLISGKTVLEILGSLDLMVGTPLWNKCTATKQVCGVDGTYTSDKLTAQSSLDVIKA